MMRDSRQNKSSMARTVLFRYQRRACTSYSSSNSSNNIVPYSIVGCLRLWQFLVIPTCFFAVAHLVNEIGGLCNASVADLLVSLIQHSLRLQAR